MPKGPMPVRKNRVEGGARTSTGVSVEPLAVGIDASLTSTGAVALGSKTGECVSILLLQPKERGVLRLAGIKQGFREWLDSLGLIAHVAMERYGFDAQSRHAEIGEGGGVIKLVLLEDLATPVCFPSLPAPQQIKKFVTGRGNANKDEMRLGVYKCWGFEHKSNDVVDAYAAAQLARGFINPELTLTQPQKDTLQAMKNPPKKKGKPAPPSFHAEMPAHMRYELLH